MTDDVEAIANEEVAARATRTEAAMKVDGVNVVVVHDDGDVVMIVNDFTYKIVMPMSPSQAFALASSLTSHGKRVQVARARAKKEKKR